MRIPPDILHLATMLDDENEDVAVNVIANLLDREDELGDLPGILQECPNSLVRRRAHQLQAALTMRGRRRAFFERLQEGRPDIFEGLIDLHLLWFDRDSRPELQEMVQAFRDRAKQRPMRTLDDAEYFMHREKLVADVESSLRPEDYCIGAILEQHTAAASVLVSLIPALMECPGFRVVRTLGEFGVYDGEGRLLLAQGDWRVCPAPDLAQMEFWEVRSLLRFAATTLFTGAVGSDSFRYVLTIGQALSGDRGDGVLDYLPYPYRPEDEKSESEEKITDGGF